VERINTHLDHEQQQKDSGDLKETSDIDQMSKLGPTKREPDRSH
jgi:hypothetical protein